MSLGTANFDKEIKKKVRTHYKQIGAGSQGSIDKNALRGHLESSLEIFHKQLLDTRFGKLEDKKGRFIPAYDVSFAEGIRAFYGMDFDVAFMKRNNIRNGKDLDRFTIKKFLKDLGIFSATETLSSAAKAFGKEHLNIGTLESALIGYSTSSTADINSEWRFIIPEVILAAIRIDYEHNSFHQNWINQTIPISDDELKMPQIKRGDAVARRIEEGESIPFGSVEFGQKKVGTFKVGTGFSITDELIMRSNIDMMFQFLGEVGNEMGISADVEALNVLVNGDQDDASESAPVVGVINTTTGFQWKDIKRVTSRMSRLRRTPNRILTGEDDGIDISEIDKFQGFDGNTRLSNFRSILGVPDNLENDVWTMPANQVMFLDPSNAMAKLQHGSMFVERDRQAQTQEDKLFVTNHIGFAILRRDARVILDKSITYSGNEFPAYMDIDSRINSAFKNVQGN